MKDRLAVVVAAIVVVAYGVAIVVLWPLVGDGETEWARRLLLFSGVEAIAFAAVGWLFGKEVNRGAAEQAKESGEKAREEAAARGVVQGKAETLAAAVRSAHPRDGLERAAAGSPTLRGIADELFPPP